MQQLLRAWGDDDIIMKDWLQQNKYMSHDIVNEQISIMGLSVLRSLLSSIKECSPLWYAIIGDEATDVVNREQLNVSIRWVNNDHEVNEDPVGLFAVPNTTSDTLCTVIEDILIRCNLPLSQCRGRPTMGQGKRNGVATKIKEKVPAALPVHCFAHSLNLCLQDAGRKLEFLPNALDTTKEIAKLIKFSPKRSHLFSEKLAQPDSTGVSIKPLCPTRWTARTGAIEAVLKDYSVLINLD